MRAAIQRTARQALSVWAVPAALLCAVVLLGEGFGSSRIQFVLLLMLAFTTMVVGLYAFMGTSGVLMFGHIGFVAVGAYTSALLTIPPALKANLLNDAPGFIQEASIHAFPALLVGGALAALVAFIFSIPLMRLSGLPAGIATLAILIIIHAFIVNTDSVTAGQQTLLGIPSELSTFGMLAISLAAMLIVAFFQSSRTGLMLRASREDELAAYAVGIEVPRIRRVAFVLSAALLGIGGGLYGQVVNAISGDFFLVYMTLLTLMMLVVGGVTSLWGAVLGTLAVTLVTEILNRLERGVEIGGVEIGGRAGIEDVGLALLLLAALIWRPEGLTRGREADIRRWRTWIRRMSRTNGKPVESSTRAEERNHV